ncbi:YdeI/OmpD-associated family protein [cf. Phormidesmis sp. LEGE 11477]|uniref:YdeI/OmpD-associated family protein n=1 Tax=cf. Phormidesmis sp. LEGE 11477 TaxID=1828680 RepID=UPI00187E3DB4|nr:YdeI/OmpD-associated family protein [cf. Phormidesmis sp. LEGE 11477]
MANLDNLERVEVDIRQDWRSWLSKNQSRPESIWLVTYKKHMGDRYLSYDAIVEEALCFGWIDSLPRKLDADRSMLLISPRQPKSVWSKLNKERVERLIREGLMTPAGMKKVERAKANGSWTFLDDVEALLIPEDLSVELEANPVAKQNFEKFSPSSKKGILQWIKMAKRSQTRRQRIEKTVAQAALNQKAI